MDHTKRAADTASMKRTRSWSRSRSRSRSSASSRRPAGGDKKLDAYFDACFASSTRMRLRAAAARTDACVTSAQPARARARVGDRVEQPRFVVKYGPPSSGKSAIAEQLGCEVSDVYVDINVDDYVVLAARFFGLPGGQRHDGTSLLTQDQYWHLRKAFADDVSDRVLSRALASGCTVFVETTGTTATSISWFEDHYIPQARAAGYCVVGVFPLVTLKHLVERCAARPQAAVCTAAALGEAERMAALHFPRLVASLDSVRVLDNDGRHAELLYRVDRAAGRVRGECVPARSALDDPQLEPVVQYLLQQCGRDELPLRTTERRATRKRTPQ